MYKVIMKRDPNRSYTRKNRYMVKLKTLSDVVRFVNKPCNKDRMFCVWDLTNKEDLIYMRKSFSHVQKLLHNDPEFARKYGDNEHADVV